MIWLLLIGAALADEPASQFVGTGQTATATVPSWLVPEPYFDRCLANGRAVSRLTTALDRCEQEALAGLSPCAERLQKSADTLQKAHSRMVSDAMALGDCTATTAVLQTQNADLRRQRNRATAISVGAVAVAALVAGIEITRGVR